MPTVEDNASNHLSPISSRILAGLYSAYGPSVQVATTSTTAHQYIHKRIADTPIALAGGTYADLAVLAAFAGYFGVYELRGIWSDTTFTLTIDPEDEDDVDLNGVPATFDIDLTANTVTEIDPPIRMYGAGDNKALELDLSGGAGIEQLHFLGDGSYET